MKPIYLMLTFVLTGCCAQAAPEGALDGGPDDGGAPDGGALCMTVVPNDVDFGDALVNTSPTQTLTLTNCGIDLKDLTLGPVAGADALLFATTPASGTVIALKSGETRAITVSFAPLVVDSNQRTAFLSLLIGGCGDCVILVNFRGVGVASCLSIDPTALNFGGIPSGSTVTKVVTLTNACTGYTANLTADPEVLNTGAAGGMTATGPFQPGTGFPSKVSMIGPGQSLQFPVAFTPPTADRFAGELNLSFDDANQSNITIPIAGAGQ
jgi:hypothetical protein